MISQLVFRHVQVPTPASPSRAASQKNTEPIPRKKKKNTLANSLPTDTDVGHRCILPLWKDWLGAGIEDIEVSTVCKQPAVLSTSGFAHNPEFLKLFEGGSNGWVSEVKPFGGG